MIVNLVQMKQGETGVILKMQGGHGMAERVQNMGIRIGKKVKKGTSQFFRGPQTVIVDNFEVAIGYGMATRILVEVERGDGNK